MKSILLSFYIILAHRNITRNYIRHSSYIYIYICKAHASIYPHERMFINIRSSTMEIACSVYMRVNNTSTSRTNVLSPSLYRIARTSRFWPFITSKTERESKRNHLVVSQSYTARDLDISRVRCMPGLICTCSARALLSRTC